MSLLPRLHRFLGHNLTPYKVRPSPSKLETIEVSCALETVKPLQTFFGVMNHYRRFIPKFGEIAVPLNQLLKKEVNVDGRIPDKLWQVKTQLKLWTRAETPWTWTGHTGWKGSLRIFYRISPVPLHDCTWERLPSPRTKTTCLDVSSQWIHYLFGWETNRDVSWEKGRWN